MVRSLPKRNNPLISGDSAPSYEDLLARRRLGKTNLAVKATQVGTSNATRPENLGPFEYAHLRAPLPKDLKGSEIFATHPPQQHPETYFLMRRSRDGYVSATGMFKIAFPWARIDEERDERDYLKERDETSEDEIAGNVWINPAFALELAKEYQMFDWVRALLDPTDIQQSPAKKQITPPPKFALPPIEAPVQLSAVATRTRRGRSASPSKRPPSPRKPRATRAAKENGAASTSAANASLQSSLEVTASNADPGSVNGTVEQSVEVEQETKSDEEEGRKTVESKKPTAVADSEEEDNDKKFKFDVDESVRNGERADAKQTTVSVEMPVSLPEAPSAEDTEKMIADAKQMVQNAAQYKEEKDETADSSKAAKKRKTDDLSEDEEDEETKAASAQRVKRARVLEEKLKRERVRNRALVGVTAAFALAASIPYFF